MYCMKNTKQGFVGIALIIILAVVLTAGGTYYITTKKNINTQVQSSTATSSQQFENSSVQTETVATIKTPSTEVTSNVSVPVRTVAPVVSVVNKAPVITWEYREGSHGSQMIDVVIDGKKYSANATMYGYGTEVKKSELRSNELSAIVSGLYGGSGNIIAVEKDGTGYKVTLTEIGGGGPKDPVIRMESQTVLKIN